MKYFTKEWYELCQTTSVHFSLEGEQRAESFSEEYFHQLYNQKLKDWLSLQEKCSSYTFDDVYPEQMNLEPTDKNMSEDEILNLKVSYEAERNDTKESYIPPEPFDRNKASEQFHEAFINKQERIKKILPEEILKKIEDIRVFILDKASRQVINAVTQYCEDNKKLVRRTLENYREYYKKSLEPFDENVVKNINFHDCTIIDIKQTEQCLAILFDNSGGFTDIDEMQFENYKIMKLDGLLQTSTWLYDEIYKTNGKYELHILLWNNMDLVELIVSAEQISFKRNKKIEVDTSLVSKI